ncbi:lantibiotic dehydratase [Kitasatospora sp. NPDC098663]|uniref:lantibiotic dehydratase n=1 Tax=Kitasatospora sp. NPDC098663 TaxID=3364096 RepID=UPI003825328D
MRQAIGPDAGFRTAATTVLLRAPATTPLDLPPMPDLEERGPQVPSVLAAWLRQVWTLSPVADAVGHSSPALAQQVRSLLAGTSPDEGTLRGTALSVARYLARMAGRATPNGLLAGVCPATFGDRTRVEWGVGHRVTARADSTWLAGVIAGLEQRPEVLRHLLVVAASTVTVRGDRLVVPYQPRRTESGTGAVEAALRHTAPVRAAMEAALSPILFADLEGKVQAAFPDATPGRVTTLLAELVSCRALVSNLHAPSTEPDALGHLLHTLESVDAGGEVTRTLQQIHALLEQHQDSTVDEARRLREDAGARMLPLAQARRHPVAVDLRLDARVTVPQAVAREAERAARLLARLSPAPYGNSALGEYFQRFYRRFGSGALVPLLELVADNGIGWPSGYPGTGVEPARPAFNRRDEQLLALAQVAAVEGSREIVVTEEIIAQLDRATSGPVRLPRSVELVVRIDAASATALDRGAFRLSLTSVSRAHGVLSGRFLHLLDPADRLALTEGLGTETEEDVLCAQLSFPPLESATAHVTRTVCTLPAVISLGEHRAAPADADDDVVLTAADLAVGCDGHRLYLAAPSLGLRVEAWALHALNLRRHTPPLARLITDISRAGTARVGDFDWGAARDLPFLPRVRAGRIVLAPARWRVTSGELDTRGLDFAQWCELLDAWRSRRNVPRRVQLVEADQVLPLDLDRPQGRMLLHAHLRNHAHARLQEAPAEDGAGWCEGRTHEIVIPLTAATRQPWPDVAPPVADRVVHPGQHGHSPGASTVMLASLYGDPNRQDVLLAEHLPALLAELGDQPPLWWFLRFSDDSGHCLRLRINLPDPSEFGPAASAVGTWADGLRRRGLLREVSYGTSWPDTGRWGGGPALDAANQVQAADSRAVLAQLRHATALPRTALIAANFAAITTAFAGSTEEGMRWLIDHVPAAPPTPTPRTLLNLARQLGDPSGDFAALRQLPGAGALLSGWTERTEAVTTYRARLDAGQAGGGIDANTVLDSLLHTHFLRSRGIDPTDKAACLYLARAAALAHSARHGGHR